MDLKASGLFRPLIELDLPEKRVLRQRTWLERKGLEGIESGVNQEETNPIKTLEEFF
jgi:hypothetical protein